MKLSACQEYVVLSWSSCPILVPFHVKAPRSPGNNGECSQDVLSGRDRLGEVKALAAALRPSVHFDGPLRWMTSLAASFLFSQSLALQAANAEDVVNYSDFIDSVIRYVGTIIGFVWICII